MAPRFSAEELRAKLAHKASLRDQAKLQGGIHPAGSSDSIADSQKPACADDSKDFTTKRTPAEEKQVVFPFFRLPIEAQKRICEFALVNAGISSGLAKLNPGIPRTPVHILKRLHGKPKKPPAILRASHELRSVALPVYYRLTDFILQAVPRVDEQSPFTRYVYGSAVHYLDGLQTYVTFADLTIRWISAIGPAGTAFVHSVIMALYEDGRVYIELVILPDPGQFPRGKVRLDWPPPGKETCNAVMRFKTKLGAKYPGIKKNEFHCESYTAQTDNVVQEVDDIFQIGKAAAGGVTKTPGNVSVTAGRNRNLSVGQSLFRGVNRRHDQRA